MVSSWIEHVKQYAKDKKVNFSYAMKSSDCKESYHKNKPKSGDVEKVIMKTKPKMEDLSLKAFVPPMDISTEEVKIKTRKSRTKKVVDNN